MADISNLTIDNTNYIIKDNYARSQLIDTDWQLINVDSNLIDNFSWEPLAYRRIGKIVYIHGGGSMIQGVGVQTLLATGLPKPRQNTNIVVGENNSNNVFNFIVDYDGYLKTAGGLNNGSQFLINGSYITRE